MRARYVVRRQIRRTVTRPRVTAQCDWDRRPTDLAASPGTSGPRAGAAGGAKRLAAACLLTPSAAPITDHVTRRVRAADTVSRSTWSVLVVSSRRAVSRCCGSVSVSARRASSVNDGCPWSTVGVGMGVTVPAGRDAAMVWVAVSPAQCGDGERASPHWAGGLRMTGLPWESRGPRRSRRYGLGRPARYAVPNPPGPPWVGPCRL